MYVQSTSIHSLTFSFSLREWLCVWPGSFLLQNLTEHTYISIHTCTCIIQVHPIPHCRLHQHATITRWDCTLLYLHSTVRRKKKSAWHFIEFTKILHIQNTSERFSASASHTTSYRSGTKIPLQPITTHYKPTPSPLQSTKTQKHPTTNTTSTTITTNNHTTIQYIHTTSYLYDTHAHTRDKTRHGQTWQDHTKPYKTGLIPGQTVSRSSLKHPDRRRLLPFPSDSAFVSAYSVQVQVPSPCPKSNVRRTTGRLSTDCIRPSLPIRFEIVYLGLVPYTNDTITQPLQYYEYTILPYLAGRPKHSPSCHFG